MICPYCKSKLTKVVDKRDSSSASISRRRRECEKCNNRFTTYERVENIILDIEKRSGKIEPFNREKLFASIKRAVKKGINDEQLEEIINRIEDKLHQSNTKLISTDTIGNMVLNELLELDQISYLRFASVYKNFKTLDDFKDEINKINNKNFTKTL